MLPSKLPRVPPKQRCAFFHDNYDENFVLERMRPFSVFLQGGILTKSKNAILKLALCGFVLLPSNLPPKQRDSFFQVNSDEVFCFKPFQTFHNIDILTKC